MHLDAAHENFAKKDLARAGEELRTAAERLRLMAGQAPADVRKELEDAAHGLDRSEADIRGGAATTIESFDRRLARANASLARYHFARAKDARAKQDLRMAGREIQAAVDQLETGARRLGHALEGEAAAMGSHARSVGQQLAGGAQVVASDVDSTLTGLGREIDKLAQAARSV
jgi:hypothetical protein